MTYFITDVWYVEDVKERYPHLTDAECKAVLIKMKRNYDANIGFNYDALDNAFADIHMKDGR